MKSKKSGKHDERCYLCGIPVRSYALRSGERPSADFRTRDHVPPSGLFLPPKPTNLIAVPCCFRCNNQHSGFDERLRIAATTPFDRNEVGQKILEQEVFGGTMAKGRQMRFFESLLASMQTLADHPGLARARIPAHEFHQGMIRITKGLLFALHPRFDYYQSNFDVIDIHPKPFDRQLRLIATLKQAEHFECGQRAFQCWRHVDETRDAGVWMLAFYECFGFFVVHSNGSGMNYP
ncbi:MAG TPA: hypothetical protein VFV96_14965 [Verrucomicrobiae bacterium]|nr:hypothetical protein [Verrucomicrobiae bacterium]